jgi:transposase-like protein
VLDARYEKVREAGIVGGRAVLIAVGIDREGRRRVPAVEPADRESRSSWQACPPGPKGRGPHGVELVVADGHAGLGAAPREVPPGAFARRCHVHFPGNAPDHRPREADDDRPREPRRIHDRREPAEADLAARLRKRSPRHDRPTARVEEEVEETFTYHRPPRRHRRRMKSTSMPERVDEAIERRTRVVRIFPNAEGRSRLARASAGEAHGNRPEASRHLSTDDLREREKPRLRRAA